MHLNIETFLLFALDGLHLRQDGERETGTVGSKQQIVGQSRQGRSGIINGQGNQAIIAHALGKQGPFTQLGLDLGDTARHLGPAGSQSCCLLRQGREVFGVPHGAQVILFGGSD